MLWAILLAAVNCTANLRSDSSFHASTSTSVTGAAGLVPSVTVKVGTAGFLRMGMRKTSNSSDMVVVVAFPVGLALTMLLYGVSETENDGVAADTVFIDDLSGCVLGMEDLGWVDRAARVTGDGEGGNGIILAAESKVGS